MAVMSRKKGKNQKVREREVITYVSILIHQSRLLICRLKQSDYVLRQRGIKEFR